MHQWSPLYPLATGIIGTGSFLPPTIIDNNELAKLVKTNDEWIREHTGIAQRHIATDETTSAMHTQNPNTLHSGQNKWHSRHLSYPEQYTVLQGIFWSKRQKISIIYR